MGAVLLPGLDSGWRSRLHRHIGRNGGYRPLPVLCLRRDLPGPADPGPHDLQDVKREAVSTKLVMPGLVRGMTEEMDLWRALKRPVPSGNLLDLDPIGIERQMAGDLRHRRKWRLVGPDRVFECLAVGVDAEIIRVSLVGAVRHPVGARQ